MARGRGRNNRGQRDDFSPSLEDLLAPLDPPRAFVSPLSPSDMVRTSWTEIEDRRRFDPERALRPALSFSGAQAPAKRIPATDRTWSTIGFDQPDTALICARRKERREVMFALRRRRRGGGGSRRRNYWSNIKC